MTEAAAANAGRTLSTRYTLLEKLGAGGQAEVWRARDEVAGVEVALKVLSPSDARNEAAWAGLVREHAIGARLEHPYILKMQQPYRDGDFAALPMELATGGDLRKLRGAGYLDVVPVLIDIAQALEYAHEQGVIHRDLKPGNVLFDARGRVRVTDFGIASAPGLPNGDVARPGLSPFTASPEQLRGDPPAFADDIYGLGALAYELLSGYPPYYPRFEVKRVLEEPVPQIKPARLMPPQLGALVMRMLSKRPALRPRSMREVIDELDAALNDTLTFEFDAIAGAGADSPPPAMRRDASVLPAAEAARASDDTTVGLGGPGARAANPTQPAVRDTNAIEVLAAEPVRVTEARAGGSPDEAQRIAAAAEAMRDAAPELGSVHDEAPHWDDLRVQIVGRAAHQLRSAEAPRRRSWPWVLMSALAAAAIAVFVVLPRYGTDLSTSLRTPPTSAPAAATAESTPGAVANAVPGSVPTPSSTGVPDSSSASGRAGVLPEPEATATASREDRLKQNRAAFDQRLAALDARGAGVWGGADFAAAKTRAAESVGAHDAGSLSLAEERLNEALRLLGSVESRAAQNLATQLATGDRALAAGQAELSRQAYESARRIDPNNRRATEGLQRVRSLGGVLPLLADGENAEAAKDYARAVQDYSQALSLDPGNVKARAGLDRAHAAFGQDSYAKAVGTGFAALGAGRLDEARTAFEKARGLRPSGTEAQTGLQRVGAALSARGYASTRQRAAALEAEERWTEAFNEYDAALKVDPSLVFAQQGKARAAARADLASALQGLIDRPERLAAESVRVEADALLRRAAAANPSGPVLRSQIARLQILLPEFDVPVRLEMVSDNATQVQIQRVGTFGTFSKREIELKPGKYTVVGTRPGFRDVRRDVTIAPGRDVQTISVSCVEPI